MMIHDCSSTMFPVKAFLCGQGDDRQADGGCQGRGQVLRSCDPRVLREARRKFARNGGGSQSEEVTPENTALASSGEKTCQTERLGGHPQVGDRHAKERDEQMQTTKAGGPPGQQRAGPIAGLSRLSES